MRAVCSALCTVARVAVSGMTYVSCMSTDVSSGVSAKMKMLRQMEMEARHPANKREHAKSKAHDETDQIKKFPVHLSLTLPRAVSHMWTQHVQQSFRQFRRFQDRVHQHQAAARILMLGQAQQRAAYLGIVAEPLRTLHQPQVQIVFHSAHA